MADLASRSFKRGGRGNFQFKHHEFPQNSMPPSLSHRMPPGVCTTSTQGYAPLLFFAKLQLKQQPMGLCLGLPTPEQNSGRAGHNSSPTLDSTTPSSKTSPNPKTLHSPKPLPLGYTMATPDRKIVSALREFCKHLQPLPRPSNWTITPAPPTKTKAGLLDTALASPTATNRVLPTRRPYTTTQTCSPNHCPPHSSAYCPN